MRDYYFPRTKLANLILNQIQTNDSMNMTLFKQRRSGKTSFLIKDLIKEAEKRNDVFCFYLSFWDEYNDVNKLFVAEFINQIKHLFTTKDKIKNLFKFIQKIGLNINYNFKENDLDFNFFFEKLKENDLSLRLNFLFKNFHETFPDKKLFLLLDEFQELAHLKQEDQGFIKDLRTAIDINHTFVKVIFTGSSYNKLLSFFNDYNQPFYNFGSYLNLEDLDEDFLKHIHSSFFENTNGRDVDFKNLKYWFNKTNKSPYYVTEALKNLQRNVNSNFDAEINRLLALDKELFDKELVHINFWNGLSNVEKYLLLFLIKSNGKPNSKKSIENIRLILKIDDDKKAKNKIEYAIKKLINTEKVAKINNQFQIVDLKLKEWIINSPAFNEFLIL